MKEETTRRTKYTKEEKKMYKARMRRFKKENKPRGSGFITFLAALTAWGLVDTMFKAAKIWEKEIKTMDFEKIWSRLQAHQGEDFFTVRGICFRYRIERNELRPICRNRKTGELHPTNRVIPKNYVRIVWEMMPLDRPSDILRRDPRITGCSYLFSLFQDKRITE